MAVEEPRGASGRTAVSHPEDAYLAYPTPSHAQRAAEVRDPYKTQSSRARQARRPHRRAPRQRRGRSDPRPAAHTGRSSTGEGAPHVARRPATSRTQRDRDRLPSFPPHCTATRASSPGTLRTSNRPPRRRCHGNRTCRVSQDGGSPTRPTPGRARARRCSPG